MSPGWVANAVTLMEAQQRHAYTRQQLGALLEASRFELQAPQTLTVSRFIKTMEHAGRLTTKAIYRLAPEGGAKESAEALPSPDYGNPRYIWDTASAFEVALTMRAGSYLSHASAVYLHALTTQIPRTIYINKEQSPKPSPTGKLTQGGIDRAFKSAPRKSTYLFLYENTRLVMLSGKNTGNLEVSELADTNGVPLRVTKLERTLIDVTVRPIYSGGVFEVLAAYRGARERASVSTLVATLKKLDYVYPYHQAIGFYMERAGYPASQLSKLERIPREHDFYLTHRTADPQYDKKWRIFYPAGLD